MYVHAYVYFFECVDMCKRVCARVIPIFFLRVPGHGFLSFFLELEAFSGRVAFLFATAVPRAPGEA